MGYFVNKNKSLLMMVQLLLMMMMLTLLTVDALSLDATTKKLLPKARAFTKRSSFALHASSTNDNEEDAPTTTNLRWFPTRIELDGITRSYGPPNLWRQLTSSVPAREFALQNITVAFGNKPTRQGDTNSGNLNKEDALCLLLGASSSGKSTLVGTILNSFYDTPDPYDPKKNQGAVTSRKFSIADITEAYPILLDDRGAVNELGNSNAKTTITVAEAWSFAIQETLEFHPKRTEFSETMEKDLTQCLIQKLSDSIFALDPETRLIDLTPSERYRFCLGKACINSSVMGTILVSKDGENGFNLPGPILFLDEWMDVETSEVVRKVQPSLQNIVQDMKGVVISITHKPELYYATGTQMSSSGSGDGDDDSNIARVRTITLSAGKILSDL